VSRRHLLSIDGGGIRGIIPAIGLSKLESTTGHLTRDIFPFVAGTSQFLPTAHRFVYHSLLKSPSSDEPYDRLNRGCAG
jgi:hypothetical protein